METTVKMPVRFDFNAHREFGIKCDNALSSLSGTGNSIIIEFSQTTYMDSAALGMLLMLRDKAKKVNAEVVLSGMRGAVKDVLGIANFHKLFTFK
jgi:HptB-dependent secretion and biofilm anti anti-sigma factor